MCAGSGINQCEYALLLKGKCIEVNIVPKIKVHNEEIKEKIKINQIQSKIQISKISRPSKKACATGWKGKTRKTNGYWNESLVESQICYVD